MIIYNSGFLILDYDPGTDILTVSLPPMEDILIPEISRSFGIIVENARNYDIKRLLFNASDAQAEVQEEAFVPVISEFVKNLCSTRVQKIARVTSSSFFREHVVKKVFKESPSSIQFQSFTEVEPALEWLKEELS
ncbi:hypothetical protein ACFSC6_15350 [Rufibacter sediminis]|uniref:STAS/SEC14 domain-containing protein n=1 Tax=Rufibacter sediminis TaxID=2762756 RepID=A0ABR6VW38_9BACT|nr:hypothetical protein [Rufibacter sediminis]MBC3541411.1 hypothetical protein [Rufibacter sediminis]